MDGYKKIFKNKNLRLKLLSILRFVPSKPMLKLQYRIKHKRKLNLKDPQRYTEKIQWYKLYYRDPVMRTCADKYYVREYIESKGLGGILNELYAKFDSPEDITLDNLPNEFVLKLSNGSGTNLIVEDKNAMTLEEIKDKFRLFYTQGGSSSGREWVYDGDWKPVIVAEKLLHDPDNVTGSVRDYKILCFNGEPAYTICVSGRYTPDYCHVVYDADWNKQDVIIGESSNAADYAKPVNYDDMMKFARILSADFPAARIDFYSIEGKLYFGEITFFPWSGYMEFTPDSFDYELGSKFILPKKNN